MNPQGAQNYLRTQVLTATPEQLQMMLYDGAIRFAEQARPALAAKNWEASYNSTPRPRLPDESDLVHLPCPGASAASPRPAVSASIPPKDAPTPPPRPPKPPSSKSPPPP